MEVHGWTSAGFESVAELLASLEREFAPGGCAFAAAVEGEPLVDLWAGCAYPEIEWAADTIAVLFSATKGLTTLVAQVLCERGLLDVNALVVDYWPEFGTHGKDVITVRDVLTHTAGLVGLDGHEELLLFDGTGFDEYDEIARRLAAARPSWTPGTRHGYHASTFGWLVGELVRRVTGRSLGTYFRDEIALPLGLDLHIGTPEEALGRTARVLPPPQLADDPARLFDDPDSPAGRAFFARPGGNVIHHMADLMNSPRMLRAELGGGNGTGTARSLARLYAVHAKGGGLDGVQLLSPEIIQDWAQERATGTDVVLQSPWRWATGYHLQTDLSTVGGRFPLGKNPDAFGHGGYGGQIGGVDLVTGVSVGFVRNRLEHHSGLGAQLVQSVFDRLC